MSDAAGVQAKLNQRFAAGLSTLKQGTCMAIDWTAGTATVNIPGGTVDMPMSGGAPVIGAPCWIGTMGGVPVCLGAVSRPPMATVAAAASGGLIQVTGDDGKTYTVTYDGSMTFVVGDRVHIDWTSGGTITAKPQADPTTGAPIQGGGDLNPGGPASRTFIPNYSGTWRDGTYASGWVPGEVLCSDHNRGAFFYGTTIADSIPDNATDIHLSIFLSLAGGYGDAPTIGAHQWAAPPGTFFVTDPFAINAVSGWVDISTYAATLATGAMFGIGMGGGGNWRFDQVGVNNSGTISATWRT